MGRSHCAGKQARAYKLLVAAAKNEDVNGRVTRSQQERKQALLCGVQNNHVSNLWATQSLVFGYFCSWFSWMKTFGFWFWGCCFGFFSSKKKPSNPEGSIFISVNINDYYSMIIAMILKTKHILWCGCVWVFWCPNMYWPTSVAPSRCVSHL